jgi:hypothetical protein
VAARPESVTRAGEISGDERLEGYADLITLRPFRGEKGEPIYRESDQKIDAMVEVAWMPHVRAAPRLTPVTGLGDEQS